MARPTQSRALYVQAIGRGLRLAPGKQNCILLDITDNCLKHRLEPQSLRKVLNKNIEDEELLTEALAREEQELSEREIQVRKLKEKRDKDIQINLLEKLTWQERDNGYFVLTVGRKQHRIALIPMDDGLYRIGARLAPFFDLQWWTNTSLPLDWAQQEAEKKARMLLSDAKNITLVDRNAAWRSHGATETQLAALAKHKARFHLVYNPETITKGEAADMLDPIFEQFRKWAEAKKKVSA